MDEIDANAIAELRREADSVNYAGQTILHSESENGNTKRVRFILREFANRNLLVKLDRFQNTALHTAVTCGHTEVAEVLIDAARQLPVTSFQAFLRQGTFSMDTALHSAVTFGDVDIVKLLVEADPTDRHIQNYQGETPLYIAAAKGYSDIVKLICTTSTAAPLNMDGPGGKTALHAAVNNGVEVVETLIASARLLFSSSDTLFQAFLRKGDEIKNTALHEAVIGGHADIVKLLVEADPQDGHTQNGEGKTPMYIAVEKGFADIVKVICTTLAAPLNLDGPDGSTALHAAIKYLDQAKNENRDVIRTIITTVKADTSDANAEERLDRLCNRTDENKCIVLELAVERNYVEVVELLLAENGAYHHYDNSDFIDLVPLIYRATEEGHKDIVKLLTEMYERAAEHHYVFLSDMAILVSAIGHGERESVIDVLGMSYAGDLVNFVDHLGWTALHHAAYHEFDSIIHPIVEEQKKGGHHFLYQDKVLGLC